MPTFRPLLFVLLLSSLCVCVPGQATLDANQGPFAGAAGVLAVDGSSTGLPGRLLTKPVGYFTSPPIEQDGKPDFRVQTMFNVQQFPLAAQLQIDAFSIGMDWIISNDIGECSGPEGRWAVLLFSVTRGNGPGMWIPGSEVEREASNGQDGAAGDLFCYEFKGGGGSSLAADAVSRALDSTDIHIQPTGGTGNMIAYDWFAAQYSAGDAAKALPNKVIAYFSVTGLTAQWLPPQWYGNAPANQSGATVFKTTWGGDSWSTPSVYLAPSDLNLAQGDDVDALAVDTMHHFTHYVLFSTKNPLLARILFYNHGTGYRATYRFSGGPTVESRLGLGTGDVDALCAADPNWDELAKVSMATETPVPAGWPPSGGGGVGGGNDVSCVVTRRPGSDLLGFGASRNPTSFTHDWWLIYPGMSPMTFYNVPRFSSWKGKPSRLVQPMSTSLLGLRAEFGVRENNPVTLQQTGSRFVGIEERRETEHIVQSPAAFADTEGLTSAVVWPGNTSRHQSIHDTSNFTSQGVDHPILIDELAWRQDGPPGLAVSYGQVQVVLGHAAVDYSAITTSFSANQDPLTCQVRYSGPVTVTPVHGSRPNDFNIRLKLTQPFLYDPSTGPDLLVEIVILSPPSQSYSTVVGASYYPSWHRATAVSVTGYATFGATSPYCPVIRFGYRDPTGVAKTTSYGTACYEYHRSFYELFPAGAFDLGGWPPNWPTNSLRLSLVGSGSNSRYTVAAGSNDWHVPTGPGLAMTDDVWVDRPLPMSLNTPVGALTSLRVDPNGFVTPTGTTTNVTGDPPTAEMLLTGPPRWALGWADLLPDGPTNVNNVYADYESATNTYYVTWLNVGTFVQASGRVTMQLAFNLNTSSPWVEYRWQGCRLPSPAMVGWTPGNGALDPGSRDLHELPLTGPLDLPVRLTAAPRAIIGSTVAYTFGSTDLFNPVELMLLSLNDLDPSLELAFLGMPGCRLYIDPTTMVSATLYGPSTVTYSFPIPFDPSLAGTKIHSQVLALRTGVNPLGAVTSNAVVTTIGIL